MQELPLPMESDMYDGLECVGVLTYLPDSEGLLSEFCRIVRPGGIILLTQRTDLFAERSFPAVLEALTSAGLWKVLEVSDPQPYLPQHEEYADKIMIHYIVCQVI
jgi:SAM-dependent methyltransferase